MKRSKKDGALRELRVTGVFYIFKLEVSIPSFWGIDSRRVSAPVHQQNLSPKQFTHRAQCLSHPISNSVQYSYTYTRKILTDTLQINRILFEKTIWLPQYKSYCEDKIIFREIEFKTAFFQFLPVRNPWYYDKDFKIRSSEYVIEKNIVKTFFKKKEIKKTLLKKIKNFL